MERWDSKSLGQRIGDAIEKTWEAARKSAEFLVEKANETAHVTKLRLEIVRLEHQIARKFTKLGSLVYDKRIHQGKREVFSDSEISALIEDVERLERDLGQTQALLENEHVQVRRN